MDYNSCTFTGRLASDPETRYLPDGKAVVNFTIACGESWKDKDGNKKEKVEWVKVVAFGKLAEICGQYLNKGKQVLISGKLQTCSWDDKDGNKKYMTEIVANSMQMFGGGKTEGKGGQNSELPVADDDDVPF